MHYYYEALAQSKSKDIALQEAKKRFLTQANEQTANPFYWAGFMLIGNNDAYQFTPINTVKHWYYLGLTSLIFSIIALLFYLKKR